MSGATAVQRSGEWAYKSYILALLLLLYAFNFLDRQVINILAEAIKRDLNISDTQLGLLTGTAFGLFYSFLGIPIARLADKTNRVAVMTVSLALWSGFTALCGVTQNYLQLFLARMGVGIGEAGGTPLLRPSSPIISQLSAVLLPWRFSTLGYPWVASLAFLWAATWPIGSAGAGPLSLRDFLDSSWLQ
jgi:MFS transporter, Spinster family, sphingosine-1-phosphate transporter